MKRKGQNLHVRAAWLVVFALTAVSFAAGAAPVSSEQAATAVRGWVARQDALGARLGSAVRDTQKLTMANGVAYYAVRMQGGGTVVTSGDTADEPIVAFTESSDDLSKLDARSPLWALLNRDATSRASVARYQAAVAASAPLASKAALAGTIESARRARRAAKWQALLDEGEALAPVSAYAMSYAAATGDVWQNKPYTATSISDVRVGPLLKTKWSQSAVGGLACWNYYTPCGLNAFNDGDAGNMVCGCVATALAQVLRYFEFPTGEVEAQTRTCSWNGDAMEMTMKGGVYDWSKMTEEPTGATPEENRQEIGKLTHDAGVALQMDYNCENSGMSGAYSFSVRGAFIDTFGYKSATFFSDSAGLINGETDPAEFAESRSLALQRAIYSNLDAGLPVVVGITGHEVVADGYGYSADGLDYVHINMGWKGSADYWYLLPTLSYEGGGEGVVDPEGTMYFDDATYNVFTNATASCVISGRVLDDEGEPAVSAQIVVYRQDTGEEVATATANEHGVWGAVVAAGTYEIEAKSGRYLGLKEDVTVSLPDTTAVNWNGMGYVPTVYGATEPESLGNSWGNDIELSYPAVEVNGEEFSTLDRALAHAATLDGATVRILQEVDLRKSFTITNACTILATNPVASASAVVPKSGAVLTLAAGADVTLTNVVFRHGGQLTVDAKAGSVLRVSGVAELGEVCLATVDNLRLAGPLLSPITVDAPFAKGAGQTFGRFSPYSAAAAATANCLLDKYDDETGGESYYDTAEDRYQLRWKFGAEVPDVAAVVRYEGAGEASVNYRSFGVFFKYHPGGGIAAVLKDAALTNNVTLADSLEIYGAAEEAVTVTPSSKARFTVGEGGSLVISNLTVSGYSGPRLFRVVGGAMTLCAGAELEDLNREAQALDYGDEDTIDAGGATILESGLFTMFPGAAIRNCSVTDDGAFMAYGGGLYACGGTLNLFGGTIARCLASEGGGVYADMSYGDLDVALSGDIRIFGNFGESGGMADDNLCVNGLDLYAEIEGSVTNHPTVGVLTAGALVGINYAGLDNAPGETFAELDAGLTGEQVETAVASFFNDRYPKVRAEADGEGTERVLVWSRKTQGEVTPEEAFAMTVYGSGSVTNYYWDVESAFRDLTNSATVFVTKDNVLTDDVEVNYSVVLRSAEGSAFRLDRMDDMSFTVSAGASLVLSNLTFCGCGAMELELTAPLFDVDGGSLTLGSQVLVTNFYGDASISACPVWVHNDGTFTMGDGALIGDCRNYYAGETEGVQKDADAGLAGGVALNGGTAYLNGGAISNCCAWKGGALFIGNSSIAYASGSFRTIACGRWKGICPVGDDPRECETLDSNVTYDGNGLVGLADAFGGSVGVSIGWNVTQDNDWNVPAGSNVFGVVTCDGPVYELIDSARNFQSDLNAGVTGVIATNDTQAILVWSSAIVTDAGGSYYEDADGNRYGAVTSVPPAPPTPTVVTNDVPVAVVGLVYSGSEQTGVVANVNFTLTGNTATNAGDHVATATLINGVWKGGSALPTNIVWSIAKATYDLGGVVFTNETYVCDGQPHSILVSGDLPEGVTVSYEGNGQSAVGSYTVTAVFTGDAANYNEIPNRTATLTITAQPTPPEPPTPSETTNYPTPIAFQSIDRLSASQWALVITNRVQWCRYRLICTDDLTKGFTTTGAWEQATTDGAWTTNVTTSAERTFWKSEATWGIVP